MAQNTDAEKSKQLINKTAQLLEKMQQGDASAFNELYELTNSYVQYTVRKQLSDHDDWEDVVQEVYIVVFQQYSSLKNTQAGFAWIKQIAFRKACDYNRKKYRVNEAVDQSYDIQDAVDVADESMPMPEDILENEETQIAVRQAISELTDVQQNVLIGYYYNEMKVREIAEAMNIPEGTVMTALHRGRKAMKDKMEAYRRKNGVKLLSAGGSVFTLFAYSEANAQAVSLPLVSEAVRAMAAQMLSGAAAGAGGSAVAGALVTKVVVPIAIAAVVAAGGIGGGVHLRHVHKIKQEIQEIKDKQEETHAQEETPVITIPEELKDASGDAGQQMKKKDMDHVLSVLARYGTITEAVAVKLDDAGMIHIAGCSVPADEDAFDEEDKGVPVKKSELVGEAQNLFGVKPDTDVLPDVNSYIWTTIVHDDARSGAGVLSAAKDGQTIYLCPDYRRIPPVSWEVTDTQVLPDGGIRLTVSCLMDQESLDSGNDGSYTMQVRLKEDEDSKYGYIIEKIRFETKK